MQNDLCVYVILQEATDMVRASISLFNLLKVFQLRNCGDFYKEVYRELYKQYKSFYKCRKRYV